mmetsp:Transcript_3162/g.8246  ORF Transcript_3162/g.8246 Transcript_3162/m.8246 type:complete len:225 (+) Transcript_3162:971-1645(+)
MPTCTLQCVCHGTFHCFFVGLSFVVINSFPRSTIFMRDAIFQCDSHSCNITYDPAPLRVFLIHNQSFHGYCRPPTSTAKRCVHISNDPIATDIRKLSTSITDPFFTFRSYRMSRQKLAAIYDPAAVVKHYRPIMVTHRNASSGRGAISPLGNIAILRFIRCHQLPTSTLIQSPIRRAMRLFSGRRLSLPSHHLPPVNKDRFADQTAVANGTKERIKRESFNVGT